MEMDRGRALALAGVVLFVVSMATSAALAPDIGSAGDGTRRTLVGVQGGGPGWHKYGRVTMYSGTDVVWQERSADSYFDVQMTENGTVLAGFMNTGQSRCGPYNPPCGRTGFRRINPNASGGPAVVGGYSFPVRSGGNSEVHDVEPLGNGEYVLTDMDHERIFAVKDGEIVWQWNASNLYDPPTNPTRTDWLHINDVDRIPCGDVPNASDDGQCFLVSVRNANQLVVVERGVGVVEIINEDTDDGNDGNCEDLQGNGEKGVRCGDPAVLNHQHNPQWLGDGAVLVADSDNDRVVELHRKDGEWTPVWSLESAGGVELRWPRDADRLPNGNTLVTDTRNRRIFEINENGTVVWSIRTEKIPYEAERLPYNEPTGDLPRYRHGTVQPPGGDVPVLSTALVGLKAVWPGLPFWFRELQLLATLLSLGLVVSGGVDRWRSDDADDEQEDGRGADEGFDGQGDPDEQTDEQD